MKKSARQAVTPPRPKPIPPGWKPETSSHRSMGIPAATLNCCWVDVICHDLRARPHLDTSGLGLAVVGARGGACVCVFIRLSLGDGCEAVGYVRLSKARHQILE